jgi:hypothetical protein
MADHLQKVAVIQQHPAIDNIEKSHGRKQQPGILKFTFANPCRHMLFNIETRIDRCLTHIQGMHEEIPLLVVDFFAQLPEQTLDPAIITAVQSQLDLQENSANDDSGLQISIGGLKSLMGSDFGVFEITREVILFGLHDELGALAMAVCNLVVEGHG